MGGSKSVQSVPWFSVEQTFSRPAHRRFRVLKAEQIHEQPKHDGAVDGR